MAIPDTTAKPIYNNQNAPRLSCNNWATNKAAKILLTAQLHEEEKTGQRRWVSRAGKTNITGSTKLNTSTRPQTSIAVF